MTVREVIHPTRLKPSIPSAAGPHLLSVDLEDRLSVRRGPVLSIDVDTLVRDVQQTLALLDRVQARATFFVVGSVAASIPDLIREVAHRGHELACHGMVHASVDAMTPDEFRRDVEQALEAINKASNVSQVLGFRAPWWSIPGPNHWALELLAATGFAYDSSLFPAFLTGHRRSHFDRAPYRLIGSELWEVPPSAAEIAGFRLPGPSGFYCRLYPFVLSRLLLGRIERRAEVVHLYFHPWELRSAIEPIAGLKGMERVIQRFGRSRMAKRIESLLRGRTWRPIAEYLKTQTAVTQ